MDPSSENSEVGPPRADGALDPRSLDPDEQQCLLDWLALQASLGLRAREATSRVRATRDPRAALQQSGRPQRVKPGVTDWQRSALARCGALAVPVLAACYPQSLASIPDPPPLLFVQGNVAVLAAPAVAIVGARAATAYGLGVARRLAAELAREGVSIVSGLARGIDRAAHEGALEVDGVTVAVQARGLDDVYPHAHRQLAERIRNRGAVVSELPPGTDPLRPFFPLRNRLISGLAKVVVVVEARRGSGSLHTARHGLEQGVEVMAVPGEIDAPTALGTNRLIRDGAAPVLGVNDIFDRLSWVRCPPAEAAPRSNSAAPVDEMARRVLSALAAGPLDRAALAGRLGCPPHALALALLDLQLVGEVEEDRSGRLRRRHLP